MKTSILGLIRLCRPANLPTAMADILAGAAISGLSFGVLFEEYFSFNFSLNAFLLVLASVFLYAGGVVLNDVFDLKLDLKERPERPIPRGIVSLRTAAVFGTFLLLSGIIMAFLVNHLAGIVAFVLALTIILYDAVSKKYEILGPLNMGVCRALNLILGMSIYGEILSWKLAIIPLIYIYAITLISRGEVHGDNKKNIIRAAILYAAVIFLVFITIANTGLKWSALACLGFFAFLIMGSLVKAFRKNSPKNIKKAVITGVLSIIVLDATFVMAYDTWMFGLIVLLLLPVSMLMAKIFAVT